MAIGFLVWFVALRDTWEVGNTGRVSATLEEADRLQQSDPLKAYKKYDAVLKEAKQHKVTDERLLKKLADAEKSQAALHQIVREQLQAEEAEKQRLAKEEVNREAEAKQRVAREEEQKRKAEEAQRIADEKQQAEEKRRKDAVAVYHNAPPSARSALNAVKKVEARTEVGMRLDDYSTVLGEAWADVKIFSESPEGKDVPEFSFLLVSAMGKYKLALDVWRKQINPEPVMREDEELNNGLLQKYWGAAHRRTALADSLITHQDHVPTILLRVAKLEKTDAEYESSMRSLFKETSDVYTVATTRLIQADIARMGEKPTEQAKLKDAAKTLFQKRKELLEKMDDIDKRDKQDLREP